MAKPAVFDGSELVELSAGDLALPADPTTALAAATKQYVDARGVSNIVAGTNISIDKTNPLAPVIALTPTLLSDDSSFTVGSSLVQRGTGTCAASGTHTASTTITFPVAFEDVPVVTAQVTSPGSAAGNYLVIAVPSDISETGCTIDFNTNSSDGDNGNITGDITFNWTAEGKGTGGGTSPSTGGGNGFYVTGGTLVATADPISNATKQAFGPFSSVPFDLINTFTPVAGHMYRIDFEFSTYAAINVGVNLCIRNGSSTTKGYFYAPVFGGNPTKFYSVSGSSFTQMTFSSSLSDSPIFNLKQKFQLFIFIDQSATHYFSYRNINCRSGFLSTTANSLVGAPVAIGYETNLTTTPDVMVAKIYDMGEGIN